MIGPAARRDALILAALLALSVLLLVPTAGQRQLADSHEARFAVLARDMLDRGAPWGAQIGGQVYRNKPPLYPWSIALFSLPGRRVTEATAHAPIIVAAVLTVGLTWWLGRRMLGGRAAWLGGLVLLAFFDFFAHAQILFPEMLLTASSTAALALFWRAVDAPAPAWARIGFWIALAFAVFAKGPAGLLPLAVVLAWLWTERDRRDHAGVRERDRTGLDAAGEPRRPSLAAVWSPWGVAAFAAITLGWLAPYLAIGGGSFARDVLWTDWLGWFVGLPELAELQRLAGELTLGTLPWTMLLLVAAWRAARSWSEPAPRLLLLAVLVPLVLVASSDNPRARYLVPVYPAAALLVAWWVEAKRASPSGAARLAGAASLALAAVIGSSPFWFRPLPRHFLPADTATRIALGALVVAAGVALVAGLARGRPAWAVTVAAAMTLVTYAVGVRSYNAWNNTAWNYKDVGALVARESRGPRAVVYVGRDFYQLDFYAGRHLTPITTPGELWRDLAAPDRPVAIVRGRQWREVAGQPLPAYRVLGRLRAGEDEFIVLRGE